MPGVVNHPAGGAAHAWLRAIAFAIVILPSMARADTTPPALVPVRVAITPVYYGAIPILYALKTGMFAKAGLDIQLQQLPTGSAITAAFAGGSVDVGKSSFSGVVSAFSRGVPITVIAPGVVYDAKAPNGALLVLKSSSIRTPGDLAGKTSRSAT